MIVSFRIDLVIVNSYNDMKREIIEFLKQYPQYNDTTQYSVTSQTTAQYCGDYEIHVWKTNNEGKPNIYVGCWWCQVLDKETSTTYIFEKEEEINVLSMQACIDSPIYLGETPYKYDENDPLYYTDAVYEVIHQYTKDNIESIKKLICEKIMSGEIPIKIYSNESDCLIAPIKQLEKSYKIYNV